MPTPTDTSTGTARDPTFRNYDSANAADYAKGRSLEYPQVLIDKVISAHVANGTGQLGTVVDVGCGPGNASRQIGKYFDHVYGLDPSAGMIETAKSLGGTSRTGEKIKYAVCSAEEIDVKLSEEGNAQVDLITVATAAHWFDLPKFYAAASRLLRPGGSIALWTSGAWFINKPTVPHNAGNKVQQILDEFLEHVLSPYKLPGNRLSHDLYTTIDLPWTCNISGFDEKSLYRKIWNKDGEYDPELAPQGGFIWLRHETWGHVRHVLGTASMVTRWREANQEAVQKGEIEDCVDKLISEVRDVVNNGKKEGEEGWVQGLTGGSPMALLVIKKI